MFLSFPDLQPFAARLHPCSRGMIYDACFTVEVGSYKHVPKKAVVWIGGSDQAYEFYVRLKHACRLDVYIYIYISQSYKSYHILYIIYYIQYTYWHLLYAYWFRFSNVFLYLDIRFFQKPIFIEKSSLKCPSFYWLTNHVIFICTCNRPQNCTDHQVISPFLSRSLGWFLARQKTGKRPVLPFCSKGKILGSSRKLRGNLDPKKQINYKANLDIRTTDHWNPGSTWHCKNGI